MYGDLSALEVQDADLLMQYVDLSVPRTHWKLFCDKIDDGISLLALIQLRQKSMSTESIAVCVRDH